MKVLTKLKEVRANQGGFTLIELLVVIGILAILLAITLIAINPNKHFQDTRNAQRSSNVSAILDGIYEYESANNGNLPPSLASVPDTAVPIKSAGSATVATGTALSGSDLTFTVASGNTIDSGSITVTGCSEAVDNGTLPVTAGTDTTIVATNSTASSTSATGCSIVKTVADVCTDLVPTFLADLPTDPSLSAANCTSGTYNTGYKIAKTDSGRFTVTAPDAEGGATISVTR